MPNLLHAISMKEHCGPIDPLDPRARIVSVIGIAFLAVFAQRFITLGLCCCLGAFFVCLSGLPWKTALQRLLPINVLMLLLVAFLPFSTPGDALWRFGPLCYSEEGFALAVKILLKGNAVLLWCLALCGRMDPIVLGHALNHLHVPDKLTHLLLFTVRYLDVLQSEYGRMRVAMRVRGFQPGVNRHTYRSFGHLIGMLLVRSIDRAERIAAAMKCRGFRGHFYILDHFEFTRRDTFFCAAMIFMLALLSAMEWK